MSEFEVVPPRTPTRRSRARILWTMVSIIRTCLRTGYRFRLVVTEDPTQNDHEDAP